MSILKTVPESEATGYVAEVYSEDLDEYGYVAAHTKVMLLNPEVYAAWEGLITAIARPMDKRRYELVTLAAAQGAKSEHCRLAHGRKSLKYIDEDELVRIAADYRSAGLSDAEVTMMEFAEKVSGDSSSMTDDDSERLRSVGFSDREIVDIALAAAARNYYSRAVQALAIDLDEMPGMSPRLRSALVDHL
jgi:uncharacterized peroxidase-related enzyme